jgi:hypothetical protein
MADNSEGELYHILIERDLNVWRLIKFLKERYLDAIDGTIPAE